MGIHLVTGGAGFVGKRIVETLVEAGYQVRSIDLLSSEGLPKGVEHFQGSILDRDLLKRSMGNVEVLHHVAAAVPLAGSRRVFEEMNVEGTRLVLDQAIQSGARHFNYVSSSAVYGKVQSEDCPLKETSPPRPFEAYGASKLRGEELVMEKTSIHKELKATIIRPRTVLGPGRLGIFDLLFHWVANNKNIYIIGPGTNKIQLVHVDDLARFSVLAAEQGASGIYNVGTDRFNTMNELLRNLCHFAGSRSKIVSIPTRIAQSGLWAVDKLRLSPFSSWHYTTFHRDYYFDLTKAMGVASWRPRFSNEEMLIESYKWYLQNSGSKNIGRSIHNRPLKKGLISLFTR